MLQLRDFAAELRGYADVGRRAPGFPAAWLNQGRPLHEVGRPGEPRRSVYARGILSCPGTALQYLNLGVLQADPGDPDLALDPRLAGAHCIPGLLQRARGETPLAVRHLECCQPLGWPAHEAHYQG